MNKISPLTASRAGLRGLVALSLGLAMAGAAFGQEKAQWVLDRKSCDEPVYPRELLSQGVSGTTHLRVLVGDGGKVMDIEIEKSSGNRKLDSAAQRAIAQCTFKPATPDAKPKTWQPISFAWKAE
jgi:TonB family protein